ncbi:Hypothetical protein PHPALM_12540 [Phytophthora palmivora]|uniref:Phosphoribosyltransferase domain-containing protein n=1 Tax=Phytophthora palmivora TaxID=4796 RepID=A0A2P4XZI8_9STRA|nr:Hypothetical protein PHPALM_12540 [Phytophthora palmivora]
MCITHEQRTRAPERPRQGSEVSNVKSTVQISAPRRTRKSRYLCEKDRWEIIKRIDAGEQQVSLANEFRVSRTAISNLYKNRQEILTRAVDDPHATHPKKSHKNKNYNSSRPTSTITETRGVDSATTTSSGHDGIIMAHHEISPLRLSFNGSRIFDDGTTVSIPHQNKRNQEVRARRDSIQQLTKNLVELSVHEAAAHSYPCKDLIAELRDESISTDMFRQRVTRLMRLLIEEAFTCLPHENAEVMTQHGDICHFAKTLDEGDICGISMESKGNVLLQAFLDISPISPVGIVNGAENNCLNAHLPTISPDQVVLLFDIQCATGDEACEVLRHLVHERNVSAGQVYYVTIISSFEGLQKVFRKFPGVTLVTAQMDTLLDQNQQIRPGIGDFMQRFWGIRTAQATV